MSYDLNIGASEAQLAQLGIVTDRIAGVFRYAETGDPVERRGDVLRLLKQLNRKPASAQPESREAKPDTLGVSSHRAEAASLLKTFLYGEMLLNNGHVQDLVLRANIASASLSETVNKWARPIEYLSILASDDKASKQDHIARGLLVLGGRQQYDDSSFDAEQEFDFKLAHLIDPESEQPVFMQERESLVRRLKTLKSNASSPPAKFLNRVLDLLIQKAQAVRLEHYDRDSFVGVCKFYDETRSGIITELSKAKYQRIHPGQDSALVPEREKKRIRVYFTHWKTLLNQIESIINEEVRIKGLDLEDPAAEQIAIARERHAQNLKYSARIAHTSPITVTTAFLLSDFAESKSPRRLWAYCFEDLRQYLSDQGLNKSLAFIDQLREHALRKAN
ncbi:MAG: hypothetical protein OXU45_07675 [Candidatus Melainabacteria bacterium]|nr:hypothetical protein [Candidatus Melainabacteria bacterium]